MKAMTYKDIFCSTTKECSKDHGVRLERGETENLGSLLSGEVIY